MASVPVPLIWSLVRNSSDNINLSIEMFHAFSFGHIDNFIQVVEVPKPN
jgi:hypothetical protein